MNLVDTGEIKDLAEVARRSHVTRARMTQIMNLLLLAPDIQEDILFLPATIEGRADTSERAVRTICSEANWRKQRQLWGRKRQPN